MSGVVFTDIDDVLVLQRAADFDKHSPDLTADLCRRLLHPPAVQVLASLVDAGARLVITSNWTRFLRKDGFRELFNLGGYPTLSAALHPAWQAPKAPGGTRLDAVNTWLSAHHVGEPYAIIDDTDSGTGLRGSVHDLDGRLVLCQPGVGLHAGHLPQIEAALKVLPRGKILVTAALAKPSQSTPPAPAGRPHRR